MPTHAFPKTLRLQHNREYQRVFERKASAADNLMVMYGCENGQADSRIGLSVSRKVGGAVFRNRWKRLFREAFRLRRAGLPGGLDMVLIPRRGAAPDLDSLMDSLEKLAPIVRRKLKKRRRK